MFKKITEDIYQTKMGDSPEEKSAVGRVFGWFVVAMILGAGLVGLGYLLGLIF